MGAIESSSKVLGVEATKHIRVMLSEADHHAFRVLAAQHDESKFKHAARVLQDYIRANSGARVPHDSPETKECVSNGSHQVR
jgi:hypothetical protein